MCKSLRTLPLFMLLLTWSTSAFAQFFNFSPPTITEQTPTPLTTQKNVPITITFENLRVSDSDIFAPDYPEGFTLSVFSGTNYSVENATITPDLNFAGMLNVQVQVNDGEFDSNIFDLQIEVNNIKPVITDHTPISINKGQNFTVLLNHLIVTDEDNEYPDDFTLTVYEGSNYNVSGNTVIPDADFSGNLNVMVSVNDGHEESDKVEIIIDVKAKNIPPTIQSQVELSTNEDQSITIELKDLIVEDPDNIYPDDFKLKIPQGSGVNYTASGNTITPSPDFFGNLTLQIRVNDGVDDSDPFSLIVAVEAMNDVPTIIGQESILLANGTETVLQVSFLTINDPDTENTNGFSVRILGNGPNYTATGNRITPTPGFAGPLTVRIVVNDGIVDSPPYDLRAEVLPKSSKPLITGQQSLVVYEDSPITLKFQDLSVIDEDNEYPADFTMRVYDGDHYTFKGLTISPEKNYSGPITVAVTVNDGKDNSPPFQLKIYVIPVNDAPQIVTLEDAPVPYEPGSGEIALTRLFSAADIDNTYLTFAEIKMVDSTFSPQHDELIFQNTEHIRGIYDDVRGILSLIGNAPLAKYDSAIRTIKYNYRLTLDEGGNQSEVLPGSKYIQFTVSDGALLSGPRIHAIKIESTVNLDIPNAFTPNGDMFNDTWRVRALANDNQFDKAIVKVYNKRGVLIYESKGFEKSWDGILNGEALPVDTYYYTIDLKLSYAKKMYKGAVMILR